MLRAAALSAALLASATASAQTRHSAAPVGVAATVTVAARHAPPARPAGYAERLDRRDDARDLRALEQLLGEFDAARARRNLAALRGVENRVAAQLRAELAEVRDDRRGAKGERRELQQSRRILREFERLAGRMDRRSLATKRALLGEAVSVARQELADSRRDAGRPGRRG